jgi:lipoprotein LprG
VATPDTFLGMSTSRARLAASVTSIAIALTVTAACGGKSDAKKYPAGPQLIQQAATVLRGVNSLSFTMRTSGDPKVAVKTADAQLLRNGNSRGNVKVSELGMALQLDFVVLGKTVHLKGLTGGWQTEPLSKVAGLYDPSAILDPNRGLVQLLSTARDGKTEDEGKVSGQQCYKVHATFTKTALKALVPGISADAPADIWISESDHHVLKSDVQVPSTKAGKTGTVTITFADFGKPFSITAPAQ